MKRICVWAFVIVTKDVCFYLRNRFTKQATTEQRKDICIYGLRLIFTVNDFITSDINYSDSVYYEHVIVFLFTALYEGRVHIHECEQDEAPRNIIRHNHLPNAPAAKSYQPANICSKRERVIKRERERQRDWKWESI